MHSAQLFFSLPWGQGFALRAVVFQLAVGAGVALRAVVFQLAVGAWVALRALGFQLAVRVGIALCADPFQLAVRAGAALRAAAFQLAVRTRVALRTLAFLLSMRAPFPSHRVSCTTVSRRFHVRPPAPIASTQRSTMLASVASEASVRARHESARAPRSVVQSWPRIHFSFR